MKDPQEEALRAALHIAIDNERSLWTRWEKSLNLKRQAQEALLVYLNSKKKGEGSTCLK